MKEHWEECGHCEETCREAQQRVYDKVDKILKKARDGCKGDNKKWDNSGVMGYIDAIRYEVKQASLPPKPKGMGIRETI